MQTLELNDDQIGLIKHTLGMAEVTFLDLESTILKKTSLVRGINRNSEFEVEARRFYKQAICFAELLIEIEKQTNIKK